MPACNINCKSHWAPGIPFPSNAPLNCQDFPSVCPYKDMAEIDNIEQQASKQQQSLHNRRAEEIASRTLSKRTHVSPTQNPLSGLHHRSESGSPSLRAPSNPFEAQNPLVHPQSRPANPIPNVQYSLPGLHHRSDSDCPFLRAENPPLETPTSRSNTGIPGSDGPDLKCWDHGCNGREFSTCSNLARHKREKSSGRSIHACHRCGATFVRKSARNDHLSKMNCASARGYSNSRTRRPLPDEYLADMAV